MSTQQKIRAGIIGTGGIAGTHLASLKNIEFVELVCGCDVKEDIINKRAKEFNFKPYTSYEEMLNNEKVDFVLLCTPQMVRKEPIAFCAEKGIPVFTEKPPASNLKEAREIEKIIKDKNLLVSVGFCMRYEGIVSKALELLKGRQILLLQLQYLCPMMYPDARAPRDFYYKRELSGGLVGDQAIHLLDLCRYVLKDEMKEVQAFGANLMQPKTENITTEESVVINMRSRIGTLISYLHTWTHRTWSYKMEIFAPDARLILDMTNRKLTGVIDGVEILFSPQETYPHYYELYEFIKYLLDGTGKILSPYSDSVKTMELVEGIMKSIDEDNVIKF